MKIDRVFMIILGLSVIYLLFFKKEKMTADANTKKLIQDHYKIDVDAIRNLSKLANDLTKNGKLKIPGGLEIDGKVTIKGETVLENKVQINNALNIKSKNGTLTRFNFQNKGEHHINGITNLNNDIRMNGYTNFRNEAKFHKPTHFKNQKTGAMSHLNQPDGNIFLRGNVIIDGNTNSGKDLHVHGITHLKNELNIHNGNNKGVTHFNHQNKGDNYIRGNLQDVTINGVPSRKLTSTKGRIGGYAIDGGGSTKLLWEGSWILNSEAEDGPLVHPKTNNVFMNAWTDDKWDIIYLYPGWKIHVFDHRFSGTNRQYENKRKDGLPIRLHLGAMGLANRVTSYKLWWVGY